MTIAGFDPSSGAGVTADLEVIRNHGFEGIAVTTALTAQSSRAVRRAVPVEGRLVGEMLAALAEDGPVAGVKIGMLGTAEVVEVVAAWLREAGVPRERVVLDPVIRSSSGAELLEAEGVRQVSRELLPLVGWVTPNVEELGALTGTATPERRDAPGLAQQLAAMGGPGLNVVVTGGHLEPPDDYLREAAGAETWFPGTRVAAASTHGTGCAFSSALLCRLLLGDGPVEAVRGAKAYVRTRLEGMPVPAGSSRGGGTR